MREDWIEATIDDIIDDSGIFKDGDWVESKDQDQNGEIRLIQLADIGDGIFLNKSDRYLTRFKAEELKCTYLKEGDILVARMPYPLGRATIFPLKGDEKHVTVVDVAIIRLNNDLILQKYLLYILNSPVSRKEIEQLQSGTTRKRISRKNLSTIKFPIAPLPEQRAIVAKIEVLFSKLDNGIANLNKAKEKLEICRQAVLKEAFEGELTKEWREKQMDLISVEELQNQINVERKKYIQEQNEAWKNAVSEWDEKGKVGSKPSKPKLREFSSKLDDRDITDLARLPESWFYNYLVYAGDLGRGKSKHRPRNDERLFGGIYPFIQTAEVRAQDIITDYTQTYSEFGLAQSKLWPKGTLCITIAANIAETGFLGIDACFPDSVVGFTPFESIIEKRYIDYFFKFAKRKISAWAPATAQKNINLNILENIIMPFCSIDEQKQVVMEIEARLSVCDNIQANIDDALNKAGALRQSILRKAFEGKLLSESEIEACKKEPDWEPAEKLLEKIKE